MKKDRLAVPARKYTDEQLDEAARLREAGMSINAIGKRLGMSPGSVSWHCLKLGADSPTTATNVPDYSGPMIMRRGDHLVKRFTPEEDARLLQMDIDGERVCDMARAIGRPANSVRGRLMTLARREERELNT